MLPIKLAQSSRGLRKLTCACLLRILQQRVREVRDEVGQGKVVRFEGSGVDGVSECVVGGRRSC